MKHLIICLLAFVPGLPLTQSWAGEPLIRWSGNYLAEDYTAGLYLNRGSEVALSNGKSYPDMESEKSPRNPRYDVSLPSAVFFGVVQTTSEVPVTVEKSRMQVRYEGGKNRISIGSEPGSIGNRVTVRGLIVWKKDGFLGPMVGTDVQSLSALEHITLEVTGVRGHAMVRFAVRSEGKWYLSEMLSEGRSRGPEPEALGEVSLSVPGSRWGEWATVDGVPPLALPPESFDRSANELKNISAIGFYFSVEYAASNAAMFEMDSFEVTAGKAQ